MMANGLGVEGDGEISFCGAIEMAGVITLKFDVSISETGRIFFSRAFTDTTRSSRVE